MRAAIKIKFYGPTNTRGDRYIATSQHTALRRKTFSYDYGLSSRENIEKIARECMRITGWGSKFVIGHPQFGDYIVVPADQIYEGEGETGAE